MANIDTPNSDLAYADTLWKAADALRGQVDAAEYKHVVCSCASPSETGALASAAGDLCRDAAVIVAATLRCTIRRPTKKRSVDAPSFWHSLAGRRPRC
jgi:hypothetical protein